jgi:hypothetical protein
LKIREIKKQIGTKDLKIREEILKARRGKSRSTKKKEEFIEILKN